MTDTFVNPDTALICQHLRRLHESFESLRRPRDPVRAIPFPGTGTSGDIITQPVLCWGWSLFNSSGSTVLVALTLDRGSAAAGTWVLNEASMATLTTDRQWTGTGILCPNGIHWTAGTAAVIFGSVFVQPAPWIGETIDW